MRNTKNIVLVTLFILTTAFVFGQTPAGSIVITGTVPGILEVTVTPASAAANLQLQTTASNLPICTVTQRSNKKSGIHRFYKIRQRCRYGNSTF